MFETHACMNITEICAVWFGNEHVVMYTHWTRSDWFEFEIPMADIIWPRRIRAWTHYSNWRWWAAFASHIYIYTPIYIYYILYFFILCAGNFNFERWSLDEANPMVQRWQIWALLAVGYHLDSTRFRHMYNLEDSMVELNSWLTLPQLSLGKVCLPQKMWLTKWPPQVWQDLARSWVYDMWTM